MKEITALQHECKYFYLQVLLNFVQFILFSVQLTITIILYLHRESLMQCEAATSYYFRTEQHFTLPACKIHIFKSGIKDLF